jgi:hypothetical protein
LDNVQAWLVPAVKTINCGTPSEWESVSRCVQIASRFTFPPATCLTRSIVICRILRRRSVHCDLRIGVRIAEGVFTAHAWVEVDGKPLGDKLSAHHGYLPFENIASAQQIRFR